MKKSFTLQKFALILFGLFSSFILVAADVLPKTFETESDAATSAYTMPRDAGSGTVDVIGLNSAWGSYADFIIDIETEGTYDLTFSYLTTETRWAAIAVNNQIYTPVEFSDLTNDWSIANTKTLTIPVYLNAGNNTIRLQAYKTIESPEFDKITVNTSSTTITEPEEQITKIEFEAENADVVNNSTVYNGTDWSRFSGGAGVKDMYYENNSYIQFNSISIPATGTYDVNVFYSSTENRSFYIKSGNKISTNVVITKTTDSWEGNNQSDIDAGKKPGTNKKTVAVYMESGDNLIIGAQAGWAPNIDKIEIIKSHETLTNPGIEQLASGFDYTDISTLSGGSNLEALNDNDELTVYTATGQSSTQIVAELPYPIILTGFAIASTNQNVMDSWNVEYSIDGSNWNTISNLDKTIKTLNFRLCQTSYLFDNTDKAAKYYRLTASGTPEVEIAEWQLFGAPYINASQNFPNDLKDEQANTISASAPGWGNNGEEGFAKAFDKMINTRYTATGTKSFWLNYDMGATTATVNRYSLTTRDGNTDRNPKDWELLASNDGSSWDILDTKSNMKFPVRGATLIYTIPNTTAYSQYRLNVTDNAGSSDVQLVQWQLFGNNISTSENNLTYKSESVLISSRSGILSLTSARSTNYFVYSVSGQLIATGRCNIGTTEINLKKGFYIVEVAGIERKVLIK